MKKTFRIFLLLTALGILLLATGCENTSVGVGFSSYDSSTGMSYGTSVTRGPHGTHGSSFVGYSSGGWGGGWYGRPHSRW